jgi:hypothetical protein
MEEFSFPNKGSPKCTYYLRNYGVRLWVGGGGGHYKPHNLLAECDAKSYEFFITYLEHRDRGLTIVKVGNGKKKTCFLLDSWLESKLYLTYGNVSGANAPCGATMQTPTHAPWILIQQSSELG